MLSRSDSDHRRLGLAQISFRLAIKNKGDLLHLYADQIAKIKNFLIDADAVTIPATQKIRVLQTPPHLEPIRASASYSCPITKNRKEPAFFFISPYFTEGENRSKKIILDNLHHEYIFVTAHETYPGHHLLDFNRLMLKNPIRRQIESPLFYEGWASYAEGLVDELGYIREPEQRLFGLKRRAWRAIRAMLDIGLRTKRLSLGRAGRLFRDIGYSPRIVKTMLEHYSLTIGYQLCYTIGKFEIEKLKKQFIGDLGLKKFNDLLLQGGQIPFHLVKKRLEHVRCKNS